MSQSDMNNSDYKMENILSSGKDLSESKQFINFTVQNKAGEIVYIDVNVSESIKYVQARIQNQYGIPLNEQVFSCIGESTLMNGNDGMQQAFNNINKVRVKAEAMKSDLDKAQQNIDELEAKIAENETKNNQVDGEVNDETNDQIVEQKDFVQKSGNEVCRVSNQIIDLTNENAELIDPSRICKIKDVFINGEIDYELLHGKILEVEKLKYFGNKRKWVANGDEISFENSDFLVYPKKLCVDSHSNLSANILNRIVCNNLQDLYLLDITITYSDYKKLTASQQLDDLSLWCVTVNDENGKKLKIDKLWNEDNNVESLFYKFKDGEVTSKTAKKLAELPPFPNLCTLSLSNVQESFDFKTFGEFLKKNPTIEYCSLEYKCSNKFYKEIKRAQNDLLQTLPPKCKFSVEKY